MSEGREVPVDLGRYALLSRIASGGMGTVHLARARGERGFSRPVAIKLLHPHLAADEKVVQRFLEEARIASRVNHPHVVSVLDVGESNGTPFLVLDFVHGEALDVLLRATRMRGELAPLPVVSAILCDVLEGLQAAHEAVDAQGVRLGLVHRDVTPHNVLVSSKGAAYVTDFGIAKIKARVRVTATNDVLGKPGYMAPEQITAGTVSAATDVHAAGIVLWEALTGKKLHEGLEQQMFALANGARPDAPSTLRPEITPPLDALVLAMLARDPNARPRSAVACAERLAELVPRAPAAEVAEWVALLAQARLDRLDEVLRAPAGAALDPDSGAAQEAAARDAENATTAKGRIGEGVLRGATATRSASRPWSGPRARAVVVLGSMALLGGAFALGIAFARPHAKDESGATRAVLADTASAPPAALVPPPVSLPSAAPASSATDEAPPTSVSTASAAHAGSRSRAKPPGTPRVQPGCDPPYVIADSIKHWKRECFGSRGE